MIRVLESAVSGFPWCDAVGRHHDQKENYRRLEEGYDLWDSAKETEMVDILWNEGECKVTVGYN